ncbi:AmmeMemoRadiSam system protein B [Halococcoides cellulosivorans]|uniref:MEMO1 family protein HARCEL1_10635 n=1 Tax=Halococcoides cellulosivorans TaxID=1679096 RepID=A0A2R4X4J6_9EURY|nr:AmmeMemoRadiSam system protein B [Halococcoides cellulosivorans]AWB28709.1 AmmeMemoRadiSam system protein B [Halococcoides cellulosivorans]
MTTRSPAVAGQFYPADPDALCERITWAYAHAIGPGAEPEAATGPPTLDGVVAPHAGYPYSGPIAAHAFAALARSGRPETVVIPCPNHTGLGDPVAIAGADAWETPLGTVPIEESVRNRLAAVEGVTIDATAHRREHAAEVQVPFLQALYDDPPAIVPIAMGDQSLAVCRRLGEVIAETDACVVASTDFTHYEPHDDAMAADRLAIERIEAGDPEGLLRTVDSEGLSMCGPGPVAVALIASGTTAETLAHRSSGETMGEMREVVGYAALRIGE